MSESIEHNKGQKGLLLGKLIVTTLLIGIGLFIPANDFLWFEGWILLILFFVFYLNNILFFSKNDPELVQKRSKPVFKERWDKIIGFLMSFVFLPILFVPGFDRRFGWSSVQLYIELIGFIMFSLGAVIIFLTMQENTFLSKAVEIQKDHKVITSGPYKIVRHPMYSGIIIIVIGWCLALGSLITLIFEVIGFIGLIIRTVLEDKLLQEKLEGYKEYIQKTKKKLIPFIW